MLPLSADLTWDFGHHKSVGTVSGGVAEENEGPQAPLNFLCTAKNSCRQQSARLANEVIVIASKFMLSVSKAITYRVASVLLNL
jgi:hypothetical protein